MPKVLIAEDDLMIADMAEDVLVAHGYEVCGIARTVAEAVEIALRHRPDLAVVDVRLADGGLGTEVAAQLAGVGGLGILFATGNASQAMLATANGHACLTKPYRPADLLRGLEIVSEMVATGTASQPFPRSFQILPSAKAALGGSGTVDDAKRVLTLHRQIAAIAGFGSFALREADMPTLLAEATRVVSEALDAPYCEIYRFRPAENDLFIEAGCGWQAGVVGQTAWRVDDKSPVGRTFLTGDQMICNDLPAEKDLELPPFYVTNRIVSTIDVLIHGNGHPYGVLQISNDERQNYDEHDAAVLTALANVLAQGAGTIADGATLHRNLARMKGIEQENIKGGLRQTALTGDLQHRVRNNMQVVYGLLNKQITAAPDAAIKQAIAAIAIQVSALEDSLQGQLLDDGPRRVPRRSVLVVEDNVALRQDFADRLDAATGFVAFTAGSLGEADRALGDKRNRFDAILLDVGLPDGDGCDYCIKLRREGHGIPIVMLTGADEEKDVIRGLDAGANDYLTKPFRWPELLARLRVQLRLFDDSESAEFRIDRFRFRPAKRTLQDVGTNRSVRLTQMETEILRCLYKSAPNPMNRRELLEEIWGNASSVTKHTLETHVYRLRQKMEQNPAIPKLLLSESGSYRLQCG